MHSLHTPALGSDWWPCMPRRATQLSAAGVPRRSSPHPALLTPEPPRSPRQRRGSLATRAVKPPRPHPDAHTGVSHPPPLRLNRSGREGDSRLSTLDSWLGERRHWRRGGDSNPRSGFTPDNCLAGSPVRPLQHLSAPAARVYAERRPPATRGCSRGREQPRPERSEGSPGILQAHVELGDVQEISNRAGWKSGASSVRTLIP